MKNYGFMLAILFAFMFIGCGGGGSSGASTSETDTVVFKDSIVSGIDFNCDGESGISSSAGEVKFLVDCKKLEFKMGNIILGDILINTINTDKIIYPSDILGLDRNNTADVRLQNMIQFLQTLDDDLNPDNGIQISSAKKDSINNVNFDFRDNTQSFEDFKNSLSIRFVDRKGALAHYEKTLRKDLSIVKDTVPPMVPEFND